ncbi:uncharacterized protein [Linepithema humile]|uniref:uncharacterized protein n=1 Tax=Linepithema humile TaxID=83485 RepID=UPI00351E18FA
MNRFLTPMLAKLSDNPNKWDHAIHLAEFSFNNTMCRSTGNTPSQLLFGIEQLGEVNDPLRSILCDYNRDLSALSLREEATQKIVASQIANEKLFDRAHKKATTYSEGDYVVIANVDTTAGVNKKLIPKYKGPYMIHKSLGSDRYVVRDIPGFQITQIPYDGVVSADRMKPWIHE